MNEDPLIEKYPFDGYSLKDCWKPPRNVYSPYPLMIAGDFWWFASCNTLAATKKTAELIMPVLAASCELLPLSCNRRKLFALNVTYVVNCLDKKKSRLALPHLIVEYAFRPKRLGVSLFKIPETRKMEILCVEGAAAPLDEFKGAVEHYGLTGLRFEKLWSSE